MNAKHRLLNLDACGLLSERKAHLPRVDRQKPEDSLLAKHLLEVVQFAEIEGVLVRAVGEQRRPEVLQSGQVLCHQENVIGEEREQRNGEHERDEEQEEYVELA